MALKTIELFTDSISNRGNNIVKVNIVQSGTRLQPVYQSFELEKVLKKGQLKNWKSKL